MDNKQPEQPPKAEQSAPEVEQPTEAEPSTPPAPQVEPATPEAGQSAPRAEPRGQKRPSPKIQKFESPKRLCIAEPDTVASGEPGPVIIAASAESAASAPTDAGDPIPLPDQVEEAGEPAAEAVDATPPESDHDAEQESPVTYFD